MKSSLNNGILFCMYGAAQFMARARCDVILLPDAADVKTVLKIPGRAVIAC
jgi:hypothetical protein